MLSGRSENGASLTAAAIGIPRAASDGTSEKRANRAGGVPGCDGSDEVSRVTEIIDC